jgi:hypothetical protein
MSVRGRNAGLRAESVQILTENSGLHVDAGKQAVLKYQSCEKAHMWIPAQVPQGWPDGSIWKKNHFKGETK